MTVQKASLNIISSQIEPIKLAVKLFQMNTAIKTLIPVLPVMRPITRKKVNAVEKLLNKEIIRELLSLGLKLVKIKKHRLDANSLSMRIWAGLSFNKYLPRTFETQPSPHGQIPMLMPANSLPHAPRT